MANEEVTTQEELTPKQELLKEMDIENRYSHLDTGRLLKDAEPSDENLKQAKKELKAWSPTTKHEGEIIDKLDELYPDEDDEKSTKHTITWKDGDDVLKTTEVEDGEIPTFGDEDPKKKDFDFTGWDPEIAVATEDAVYTAQWVEQKNEPHTKHHTITWNVDGTTTTTEVEDGEIPVYDGEEPTKEGYTFTGWHPKIAVATTDATYFAQFSDNSGEPKI